MEKKYTMVLVSHTHWDREWYLPFQEFRIKLVRFTDNLLNILETDPEFKTFVFDGQTVVLEDYLEIRPEAREKIARFVQDGRLSVGPWYILPDEYLVSGEATVRNLLLGHLISEQFGDPMKSGYVPDPFGHISQMPQILKGFGIDDFYFSRGLGLETEKMTCEFLWEAPDGTSVLAVNQPGGYCSACNLGYAKWPNRGTEIDMELAMTQLQSQFDMLSGKCESTILLLNNGCDHLEAQPEVPEMIRLANERLEEATIIHGSFEDVGKLLREQNIKLPTYRGEIRGARYMGLLPGVLSARMYIKQANERTQTLLERWAEPSSALAYAFGKKYEDAFLWQAWKLCLQNHPHDSICGCSVDQVHREMMPRFEQAQQIGEVMTREGLEHVASQVDTAFEIPETAKPVVVFNAHGWDAQEPVTVHMEQKLEADKRPEEFVVRDAEGNVLPSQESNMRRIEHNDLKFRWECDVSFLPGNVPALGYKAFSMDRVVTYQSGARRTASGSIAVTENTSENEFVKVIVASNGSFDLLDKKTSNVFTGCNLFEDTEDAGDEYDYSPTRESRMITSTGVAGTISIVEVGPVFATIRVDTALQLPRELSPDRFTRSSETVACPVSVLITVRSGSPRVDVVTKFTNNAKDHRLRAWFPTGVATDTVQAEGQFDVVERSLLPIADAQDWNQRPQPERPQQSFVNVQGDGRGLTVINQGLPEYEVMRPDNAVVALTLLRCVGWLSRGDFLTRDHNAGPDIPTPDAQCLGENTFRYAVLPHEGDWKQAQVWRQAHLHNVPLRAVLTSAHAGELPREKSFVRVEPGNIVVSAFKKADRDDTLILRVYNTTSDETKAIVRLGLPIKSATLANLNEEPMGDELVISPDGSLSFDMPGFRVQTIRLSL